MTVRVNEKLGENNWPRADVDEIFLILILVSLGWTLLLQLHSVRDEDEGHQMATRKLRQMFSRMAIVRVQFASA